MNTETTYNHFTVSEHLLRKRMSQTILITGGARSGKSRYAESLCADYEDVVYIATSRAEDDEMRARIRAHRESRPGHWRTFEGTYALSQAVTNASCYLLDCLSVLTSNVMFDLTRGTERISLEVQRRIETEIVREMHELINCVHRQNGMLVLVTNEVGSSIVPEYHVARVYRDILGTVNQRVAALSDDVYLVVCGLPIKIK